MSMDQNLSVETLNYQLSTGNKIDAAIYFQPAIKLISKEFLRQMLDI